MFPTGLQEIKLNSKAELPFWDGEKTYAHKYKIYCDGSHHVASLLFSSSRKSKGGGKIEVTENDRIFDELYFEAKESYRSTTKQRSFIKKELSKRINGVENVDVFIDEHFERKDRNMYNRVKRFRRKSYLNKWTHFVTFTYDDKLHDEDSFRSKLRKSLANFHVRRGWKYIGVFERAPITKRLHFHALLFVPEGEMPGTLIKKKDWSTKQKKFQEVFSNTFFEKRFGRNDFEPINVKDIKHGNTLLYMLKYIEKSGEYLTYSRGVPTEICKELDEVHFSAEFYNFVQKFVLFDDVIEWETDVMNFSWSQMSMEELFEDPPCNA